jgi:hypothetical protein
VAVAGVPLAPAAPSRGRRPRTGATPAPSTSPRWTGSAELALYIIPEEENYLWPSLSVDRDWLHLAVRYNYEDTNTASFWAARTSSGVRGSKRGTPCSHTGDTDGVAPGFRSTMNTWGRVFYAGEWVFDAEEGDSFYYS